ncbi:putative AC9 transposase, partial [Bienertia sinuspersici]
MEMFHTYDGCVSLTSDTWTLTYGEPFVCVTAHWNDDDWLLQKQIICFEAMKEAHNGFNTKSHKLFSISLDNATANTSAMLFLKEDTSIKLLLNDGLDELRTLLEPIRNVIRWIRAVRSAKRIFKQKCEEYGLRKKVIALDTPTRWNSTYKLLHDAIAYRDVLTDMYNESRRRMGSSLLMIIECIKIICTIKQTSLANPGAAVKRLLDNMKVKWCANFTKFPPIYAIAAILDLGVKLKGLRNLLTFYYEQLDVQFGVPYYVNNCERI